MPKKGDFRHKCDLPKQDRGGITISPYWGSFQRCIFRFRTHVTIYLHQDSRQYFRSNASYLREKMRHLYTPRYKYVIHPFSRFAMVKRMIVSMLWLISFVLLPYFTCFSVRRYIHYKGPSPWEKIVVAFIDSLLIVDVICRFFVGFTIEQTREIVLEHGKIIKHYLLTYFAFDFIPLVMDLFVGTLYPWISARVQIWLLQTHLLRLPRLRTMVGNLDQTFRYMGISESIRISLLHVTLAVLIVHGWTCVVGFVPLFRLINGLSTSNSWMAEMEREQHKFNASKADVLTMTETHSILSEYFHCLTMTMCHFFGAGSGRYSTKSEFEMFIFSLMLVSGYAFYIFTLARILHLFGMVNISETKYEELVTQAGDYMVTKKYPSILRTRVHKYYEYKFNKTFFSERKILETLSEHLRMEILLYSCSNLVDKVQIFKGLSKSAVGCILALLKEEIYLPGDVIMTADDDSGTIYFILYGTVAVKLPTGREITHGEDGNHFGYTEEYIHQLTRNFEYKLVALEHCQVYLLEKQDIKYACLTYPEITNKIEHMAKASSRVYSTMISTTMMQDDGDQHEEEVELDIVAQLRKGRILEQPIRRNLFT